MFAKPAVNVGDRFIKVGNNQTAVWVVSRTFEVPFEPSHANLYKEGDDYESITVSLVALLDPRFFRPA